MPTQGATAAAVLRTITRRLDHKPRGAVERRYQAMVREFRFLEERQSETLMFLRQRKWSDERMMVLFGLNCIYQEVVGPLDASTRASSAGIGTSSPIAHGSFRFDKAHAIRVKSAADDFFAMVTKLGFMRDWMTKNTCGDLIYYIARYEREQGSEG